MAARPEDARRQVRGCYRLSVIGYLLSGVGCRVSGTANETAEKLPAGS